MTETVNPSVLSRTGLDELIDALRADGYRVSLASGVTTFARADASNPDMCSFTYTQPLDAQTAAAISVPVVSGC